jgi:hypothetical protein
MTRANDDGMNYRAPEGSQMQPSAGGPINGDYSRRKFLRAAVIGTAGVAGAAGVSGVVLARRGGSAPTLTKSTFLTTVSAGTSFMPCFEDTTFSDVSALGGTSGNNYTSSYFAVLGIHSLPQGATYTINVQQQVNSDGYKDIQQPPTGNGKTPDDAPFAYQSKNGSVLIYYETAGSLAADCPYSKPDGTANVNAAAVPVSFTPAGSGTTDVLFFLHLSWGADTPTSTETVDIQISVYAGSSTSGTLLFQQALPITANA